MVGEFPDLQGIMGSYYARADGEPEEVAAAIREHYLPRAAGDSLPSTRTGVALAIADKLDTVAGIFAIGEKPTGNKDPFGLRRAALGVQRILIEKGLDLDLKGSIAGALAAVRADLERLRGAGAAGARSPEAVATGSRDSVAEEIYDFLMEVATGSRDSVAEEIYDFLMERLRAYYLERSGD